jgi:hypothetical protein
MCRGCLSNAHVKQYRHRLDIQAVSSEDKGFQRFLWKSVETGHCLLSCCIDTGGIGSKIFLKLGKRNRERVLWYQSVAMGYTCLQ